MHDLEILHLNFRKEFGMVFMVEERKKIELNYDSMDLSLDQSGDQCQYDGVLVWTLRLRP